jgi:hypothetical protein
MRLSLVERMDLVARSKSNAPLISYARIVLLLLAPLCILLAVNSTAPFPETVLVAILGAVGLLTAVILWLNWRYKVYALALFCFLFASGDVLSHDHPHSHTVLGWIAAHSLLPLFVYYACGLWIIANRYALANSNGFREDRDQFDKWMQTLNGRSANEIEFPAGSFWTGYWTYRILNPGECWIVAQFKRGGDKLRSCRVYELKDIVFSRLPSGKWQIDITPKSGKRKSFVEVEIPPSLPTDFRITRQVNA